MQIGFYAGSFDPFTNGHLKVIHEAAQVFDKVIIGMGVHPDKKRKFDKSKMKSAIEQTLIKEGLDNVEVVSYSNLTTDAALDHSSTFLIRGIRNGTDYAYEENIASINEEISGLDTVYFRGNSCNISSSMVRELLKYGKDVSEYVPADVLKVMQ